MQKGGNLRLALSSFPSNFNTLNIDGNEADTGSMLRATMPRAFVIAADGSMKVNTDYFTNVELTGTNPQVVKYTINPRRPGPTERPSPGRTSPPRSTPPAARTRRSRSPRPTAATGSGRSPAAPTSGRRSSPSPSPTRSGAACSRQHHAAAEEHDRQPRRLQQRASSTVPDRRRVRSSSALDRTAQRIVLTRNPKWWAPRRCWTPSPTWCSTTRPHPGAAEQRHRRHRAQLLDDLTIARNTAGISIRRAPA